MSNPGQHQALYNGITLPAQWPPKDLRSDSREPSPVPYLDAPPAVVPIDVGRQLFVDDFLVAETTLTRTHHAPTVQPDPVLVPTTELEMNDGVCPVACPFNDGLFYDPKDRLFKMWYHAGWFDGVAYAVSEDGVHWERPDLDVVPGTNRVLPPREGFKRDGAGVWLDHDAADPNERYKMFVYYRSPDWKGAEVYTSPDGIHWSEGTKTSECGDNTTFFHNPFRKVWAFSLRAFHEKIRIRNYAEHPDFIQAATWKPEDEVFWAGADDLDLPDPAIGIPTELYNVDAAPYESLMIGLFAIFQGPQNKQCKQTGTPKTIDLQIAYSRDGFHWHRPNRQPFIAASREVGTWNRAYLHSVGGVCTVVGDELRFYFGAWSGISPKHGTDMYAGASTGYAVLRRDGFASMDAGASEGTLTTRSVVFQGKHLFVNANVAEGQLTVEVLDQDGQPLPGFTRADCVPVTGDNTAMAVRWRDGRDLGDLAGQPVRFRFGLTQGRLYSFWVSPDASGASYGYVAAGGPGFASGVDTVGNGSGA